MTHRRALLSVSDKTGLVELARALLQHGFELLSTSGTARLLSDAGLPVRLVESYTGSPEVMNGRVKTLHPRVHGGLLAREHIDDDDLRRLGAEFIDWVVVNLYPFESVVAHPDVTDAVAVENIDIGGPAMLRSAAKNHERVTVLCDPADYRAVIELLAQHGNVPPEMRRSLAAKAFAHTANYDAAIAAYLSADETKLFPKYMSLGWERAEVLRYGENPHQQAAFYRDRRARDGTIATAQSLGSGGKELSYNNLVDADAALEAVREFDEPAAVVVKHTNPCGVASAASLEQAFRAAREADSVSAFGGVVALNRTVDRATAEALVESFFEVVLAPSFEDDALSLLRTKKNLRVLALGKGPAPDTELVLRRLGGGVVIQQRDASVRGEVQSARVVSARPPTPTELTGLDFAWRVVKHVKSNAIVLAQGLCTVGVGAGQMSRVESVRLACDKAGPRARGSVLASDAFFPFPDGVELAAARGVTAIVQPGGSVKDAAVIQAANEADMAMVFTGTRHFRH